MANPNFPVDGQAERIDALVDAAGVVYLKLGIGTKAVSGATNNAAWHGAATHVDAGSFATSDGVSVVAGTSGSTVRRMLVDSTGAHIIVGAGATAAALVGSPVRIAGSDGTNTRDVVTDAGGRQVVVNGAVTDGVSTFAALRTPNFFKTATSVTASGNTAVWTPTSGKKFRLMRFLIVLSMTAARSSAGDLVIKFQDATTDIGFAIQPYVPGAALTTTPGGFTTGWVNLGNGFLSAAANNVLNINLAAALTAGNVSVSVAGTEE